MLCAHRTLWKKTVTGYNRYVRSVAFIRLGHNTHIMYVSVDDNTRHMAALSMRGEDTSASLGAAWMSIKDPWRIRISADGIRGVVMHGNKDSNYQVTTLVMERDVWRHNMTYNVETGRYIPHILAIADDGQVIVGSTYVSIL